ncbi:MAG: ABC transporter permease [Saprospiraceae bacterium]|nr:ABC transporter permease [Saprospiraceae bacterium]
MRELGLILDITRVHLMSRLKQSTVAALGVTFGIGMFIILMGFMTGLNSLLDGLILNRVPHVAIFNDIKPSDHQPIDLTQEFTNSLNVVRSIKPRSTKVRIHNATPIIEYLRNDERVRGVSPQSAAKVFYVSGALQINGLANGIDVREEIRLFNFGDYIVEGDPNNLWRDSKGILLGAGVAAKMSLGLGDRIQLGTIDGGLLPLKIVGIYQSGLREVDDIQSFVNIKTAQQLMGEDKNYLTDINVNLWDTDEAVGMAKRISEQFNLTAIDIETANAQFETGSNVRNLITFVVSITLLLVAGFGIYNILNMFIYEKMNDIAILKATGFSGKDVEKIFLSQALIIGLVGGVAGLILGYSVSVIIDHTPFNTAALPTIETYPVNFNPMYYLIALMFALLATFLAGYLPARKAKWIDPVEIIRGQ